MKAARYLLLLVLLCGAAQAEAPSIEVVAPLCIDGEIRGIAVRVHAPGVYGIRWAADVCRHAT